MMSFTVWKVLWLFGIIQGAVSFSPNPVGRSATMTTSSSVSAASVTESDIVNTGREVLVAKVLTLARKLGPVGVYNSPEQQEELLQLARKLSPFSDAAPAKAPLEGVHDLVYSAAPGGSSGKLAGPIYGKVTQEFVDEVTFINAVEIGPVKISLKAERESKSNTVSKVSFKQSIIQLFGNTLLNKDIGGGGNWKYIFAGQVTDLETNQPVYLRVMETPSLFIIMAPLSE